MLNNRLNQVRVFSPEKREFCGDRAVCPRQPGTHASGQSVPLPLVDVGEGTLRNGRTEVRPTNGLVRLPNYNWNCKRCRIRLNVKLASTAL